MSTLTALDGSVQSQGIKASFKDWLDIGSEEWQKTPDKVKAAAYQAAKVCGWRDEGLKQLILNQLTPRSDEFTAEFTLDILKKLAATYPVEQEQVYETEGSTTIKE